jgi:Holliday junction DNA helicase, RuvA subunit
MINHLNGTVISKTTSDVVVECAGVGYHVMIPSSVYAYIPDEGETGTIYTYFNVKEDSMELYGFATEQQRATFKMLIGVSGVGPKVGLSILSLFNSDHIAIAIASGDYKAFTECPGVGPKLAQRLVLELKDRIGDLGGAQAQAVSAFGSADIKSAAGEAVAALVSLGFSQSEAASAVSRLPADSTVEEIIAAALRNMGKA